MVIRVATAATGALSCQKSYTKPRFLCLVPFRFTLVPHDTRCSRSIRLPVNRYRFSVCTAPFVRRVLASVIHHRYGTITIFCRPITRSSRTKGSAAFGAGDRGWPTTSSRLFSISSSQGCSVFLRRSIEFKGIKFRAFDSPSLRFPPLSLSFSFSPHPRSDYRLDSVESVPLLPRVEVFGTSRGKIRYPKS